VTFVVSLGDREANMPRIGRKVIITGTAALILATGSGIAAAAVLSGGPVDSSGVIHGCYSSRALNGSHVLVLQDAGTACPSGTTAISWSQGPAGPPTENSPSPDNGPGTNQPMVSLGTLGCQNPQSPVTYTVQGSNTAGTSAWYFFSAGAPTSAGCPVNYSLSGNTGDTISVYVNGFAPSDLVAGQVSGITGLVAPQGVQVFVQVTGGTADIQFTLAITSSP
jgi:hypothetical protein